jgi:hypothetical protein
LLRSLVFETKLEVVHRQLTDIGVATLVEQLRPVGFLYTASKKQFCPSPRPQILVCAACEPAIVRNATLTGVSQVAERSEERGKFLVGVAHFVSYPKNSAHL